MKEIKLKKKDFWDVNNQGNVWIIGLFILQILLVVSINFNINLDNLNKINQIDTNFECAKIQVIQRIKKEFRSNKTEDFEMESNGYNIRVYYGTDECDVIFEGEHYVEMRVVYDIVFWALGSVEYNYDYWES